MPLLLQNSNMTARTRARALSSSAIGIVMLAHAAHAALGGDASSLAREAAWLHGSVNSEVLTQYVVKELAADSGMYVREYLNRNGTVFAVSWRGPVAPDLRPLLGEYFAEYASALSALDHPGLQRYVRIASPTLVVESGGHLRAYAGRAYLPALIPAGVPVAALR
jgi:hypothetical protein